jgi:hypothetical protein
MLKWQANVRHEFPQLLHLFTSGKWIQLKHKLNTAVDLIKGEAKLAYKMCVCYLDPCGIKTFQLHG